MSFCQIERSFFLCAVLKCDFSIVNAVVIILCDDSAHIIAAAGGIHEPCTDIVFIDLNVISL